MVKNESKSIGYARRKARGRVMLIDAFLRTSAIGEVRQCNDIGLWNLFCTTGNGIIVLDKHHATRRLSIDFGGGVSSMALFHEGDYDTQYCQSAPGILPTISQ